MDGLGTACDVVGHVVFFLIDVAEDVSCTVLVLQHVLVLLVLDSDFCLTQLIIVFLGSDMPGSEAAGSGYWFIQSSSIKMGWVVRTISCATITCLFCHSGQAAKVV